MEALGYLTTQFNGLDLNGRVAIVVPNNNFLQQLKRALESESNTFEFVDAAGEASCLLSVPGASTDSKKQSRQCLVLDTVENFNGLERLIVIAVALDSPIDHSALAHGVAPQTRSDIYRAITRAQMMVVVVNEVVTGGWLEFLTLVKFNDAVFDGDEHGARTTNSRVRHVLNKEEEAGRSPWVARAAMVRTVSAAVGLSLEIAMILAAVLLLLVGAGLAGGLAVPAGVVTGLVVVVVVMVGAAAVGGVGGGVGGGVVGGVVVGGVGGGVGGAVLLLVVGGVVGVVGAAGVGGVGGGVVVGVVVGVVLGVVGGGVRGVVGVVGGLGVVGGTVVVAVGVVLAVKLGLLAPIPEGVVPPEGDPEAAPAVISSTVWDTSFSSIDVRELHPAARIGRLREARELSFMPL
jgi:hypothetical protein